MGVYNFPLIFALLKREKGSIAQLVQSISFTPRGSAVRARVLPQNNLILIERWGFFMPISDQYHFRIYQVSYIYLLYILQIFVHLYKKNFNMYNLFKSILLVCSILLISNSINAQVNATATASATIVTGISISKVNDMNFGRLNPGSGGGTAELSTASVVTPTGDVTKLAGATPSAASFTVSGETGYTFSITLPSSDYTISDGSSHNMIVNTFLSSPATSGTIAGGGTTLSVGATLTVAAGQVSGNYTNVTGFTVTVNYN